MRIGPDSGIPGEQSREHNTNSDPTHIAAASDAVRDGWKATIKDTYRMIDDRETDGHHTALVIAAETAPRGSDGGDIDDIIDISESVIITPPEGSFVPTWGLTYTVPRNAQEALGFIQPPFTVNETLVYQREVEGTVFIVTECICTEEISAPQSLFIAGAYPSGHAKSLVRVATNHNRMFSHLSYLDGTHIVTFSHDDSTTFFPNPERFLDAGLDKK